MKIEKQEILSAFGNSYENHSYEEKLSELLDGIKSRHNGDYINFTRQQVLLELGLLTKKRKKPSKKGKVFYFSHSGMEL